MTTAAGRAAGLRARRRLLLGAAGVLGLAVVAWVALYAAAGTGIAKGATVLGVPIGGQTPAEATATLERALRDEARAPLRVRAGQVAATVHPARAGLSLDVPATVAAAAGRSWDPRHLLGALFGRHEIEPVVAVDPSRLRAAVDRLARRVDRDTREGAIRFDAAAVPRPRRPLPGRALVRGSAAAALTDAYLSAPYLHGGSPVRLPVRVDRPQVSRGEVARVVRDVAGPATASGVVLTVAGRRVVVPPRAIATALTFVPDGHGSLQPVLHGRRLRAALAPALARVETPAVDASFRISGGRPNVVPARAGREVLPRTLADAVLPVLTRAGAERAVTVPLETSEPAVSTEQANGLGVVQRVSTFTTYYPSDFPPRLQNIHRAADLMDAKLLLPGRVFSLNRVVGERTEERGFAAGYIIDNGKLEVDFGGGVSQLATTTFNAAYFAGLDIVEHHPHSFYISRYPEGREATVAWGFKDLRFRNDSGHGIFVTTSYTDSSVTVTMYGTKRYRIESMKGPRTDVRPFRVVHDPRPQGTTPGTCVASEGVPGFRVVVTRLFHEGGRQVRSERFRTRYAPENEVRCGTSGPG